MKASDRHEGYWSESSAEANEKENKKMERGRTVGDGKERMW